MMKLSALLLALALIPVYQIGFAGEIVGAWVFDEDQGDKIKDISGTGNDGIVHGAKWTKEGKFGGALEFDGDDDWVEVPNHESLQFPKGTDFTLACWIKITTPEPSPPMLIAKNYHTTSQMLPWYALYYANQNKSVDGSVSFFLRDKNSTNYHISSQSKIDDGDWHHVAGIREKGKIMLYVDGKLEAEMDGADVDVGTNDGPLHFMSHYNRFLGGVLDEVLIARYALSESDLKKLMDNGIISFTAIELGGKLPSIWGRLKTAR